MHCLSCQADPTVYSSSQFSPVETLIPLSPPPKADRFVSPRLASWPRPAPGSRPFPRPGSPGTSLVHASTGKCIRVDASHGRCHGVRQRSAAPPGSRGQSPSTSRAATAGSHGGTISHAEGLAGYGQHPSTSSCTLLVSGHCKIPPGGAAALCAGAWASVLEKVGAANASAGLAQPQGRQGARPGARGSLDVGCTGSTSSAARRGRTAKPARRGAAGPPHCEGQGRAGAAAFQAAGAAKAFLLRDLGVT